MHLYMSVLQRQHKQDADPSTAAHKRIDKFENNRSVHFLVAAALRAMQ